MTKDKAEEKARQFLQEAYQVNGNDEVDVFYERWASDYDYQMEAGLGYQSPQKVARLLGDHSQSAARVLDIGCGTGLAAKSLFDSGYVNIDGIDLSVAMLNVARERNIYTNLMQLDLLQPLPLEDNSYSALMCAGTFTHGHVDATPMAELSRILAPNGVFAFTVHRDLWVEKGFEESLAELQSAGLLTEVQRELDSYFFDGSDEGWFCLYRKLSKTPVNTA